MDDFASSVLRFRGLKFLKALRLDSCRAFVLLNPWSFKCLRKASIYRSLGVGERHVVESNGDTCHSLIGPPMSSLTRTNV